MKSILFLFFLSQSAIILSQEKMDFDLITDKWTQGKIDSTGSVGQADISLGGWYHLNLYEDGSVIFGSAFTCGFGRQREGSWKLNARDATITFLFIKEKGYLNNPGNNDIEETEIYKIEMLTDEAMILRLINSENERIYPFIKTENVK